MSSKKIIILLFLTFFFTPYAKSQESMLTEISYLYMEKLIAVAKENYPRNKIFSHQVSLAKYRLAEQKSTWLDPFNFSYLYRSNTDQGVDLANAGILLSGYQFGVTVSPSIFFKNSSAVKAAGQEVKVAEMSKAEYDLQLESEVKSRYLSYLQHLNILKIRSKSMLDIDASFKSVKARYERNEVTFQNYNDAAVSLSASQEARIVSEANLATAKVLLEELLTKKLEEIR